MTNGLVDANTRRRIADLGARVVDGSEITRDEALWLFGLTTRAEVFELMLWGNRIRELYMGNKIHLCSIVNVKAGGCPENCRFCAQSALYQTASPRYSLVEPKAVRAAAEEARAQGVAALGIVAAWRGLEEGRVLEELCEQLAEIKRVGRVRADGSLGLIRKQAVADKLKEAGLEVLQPQPGDLASVLPANLQHPRLRRSTPNDHLSQSSGHPNLRGGNHWHGGKRRGPLRPGICSQRSRRADRADQHFKPD